ncbi:Zn-dependent alcohol dehydrogenase [Actinomarinicola tropica]|uniref:Zinc-binding dehydrogenase n=1 Tax=Actinomarinicola tropica TaxID=2789776 RepID=A0A5Q2RKY6_9ACTN|nr:Zn-dependent alcohol dehydrogenase [Actinomarinicola tropica]QGG94520.1 zinc-binding dehydrogenase [Actinomarinicola tropica]
MTDTTHTTGTARAAVLNAVDTPLQIRDDISVAAPKEGEVRVKMAASGVCHSDLSVQNGTIPLATPLVLGHEGAGVITEVGPGVTDRAVGDHVVLSFVPQCGECYFCTRDQGYLCEKGGAVSLGGLIDGTKRFSTPDGELGQMAYCGTFSNESIVPAISTVKIPDDVPLKVAALIGCGVLTGVGAAMNTANIRQGDAVAVIGCGGVGLNVIQGARIAGATTIIAIDMFDSKLEMAKEFGATEVVNAGDGDPVAKVMELTGGRGADVSFEVIGLGPTIEQAINMARSGGEVVLVGVPRLEVMLNLNAAFTFLYTAKTVKGCWYGSANVDRDVPKLIELYQKGELKLDELISREIDVADVNEAFEAMASGEVARSVIVHD